MGQPEDTGQRALEQAVAHWQRRGYRVTYRDANLVQLLRRDVPDGVLAGVALAAIGAIAVLVLVRLARRQWHIVSLTATMDGRLIVHRQRASHPPPV